MRNKKVSTKLPEPELTPAQVEQQLQALELEEKKLRVEKLRDDVAVLRSQRVARQMASEANESSVNDFNAKIEASQAVCKHRKGGKNMEGIVNGNSNNYSLAHHVYPWGDIGVICTRCGKQWNKPLGVLQKQRDPNAYIAALESRKEYLKQSRAFNDILSLPTDNEVSGNQMFRFDKMPDMAEEVEETAAV